MPDDFPIAATQEAYERALAEVDRLRDIVFRLATAIADDGYSSWAADIYDSIKES